MREAVRQFSLNLLILMSVWSCFKLVLRSLMIMLIVSYEENLLLIVSVSFTCQSPDVLLYPYGPCEAKL